MKQLNISAVKQALSRDEMKMILAGSGCATGTMSCEEFHEKTGCYPTTTTSSCTGKDGCTYSYASSSGSCG